MTSSASRKGSKILALVAVATAGLWMTQSDTPAAECVPVVEQCSPDVTVLPSEPTPSTTTAPPPSTTTTTTAPPAGRPQPSPAAAAARLLELVNVERARAGVRLLRARPDVTQIATDWSTSMARARRVAHNDAYFSAATRQRLGAGILGENVAGAYDIDAAHQRWMASDGHRKNMLNPRFDTIGIGAVHQHGAWWLTENFLEARGAPASTAAPTGPGRGTPPAVSRDEARAVPALAEQVTRAAEEPTIVLASGDERNSVVGMRGPLRLEPAGTGERPRVALLTLAVGALIAALSGLVRARR